MLLIPLLGIGAIASFYFKSLRVVIAVCCL